VARISSLRMCWCTMTEELYVRNEHGRYKEYADTVEELVEKLKKSYYIGNWFAIDIVKTETVYDSRIDT